MEHRHAVEFLEELGGELACLSVVALEGVSATVRPTPLQRPSFRVDEKRVPDSTTTTDGTRLAAAQRAIREAMPPLKTRRFDDIPKREFPADGRVVAVIPAYNEERRIARSLGSLAGQTRPVDAILVMADNCTDETVGVARAAGAVVVESVDNENRKAGALNQALCAILPLLADNDTVLVMDADTTLAPVFVENALRVLAHRPRGKPIAGVGGVFRGDHEGWNLVRQLQENEYTRYARHLGRRRGHALVLTGTGTVFNVRALRDVVCARRNHGVPDDGGTRGVYDTGALTEDNELTLCLKSLGYATTSPMNCVVATAMMPTIPLLFKQRRRWQRGALENIAAHGRHRYVLPYTVRQALTYLGVLFLPFYLITLIVALAEPGGVPWFAPVWTAVGAIYVLEQTWSVRDGGWRSILTSILILPEMLYAVFLDAVYFISLAAMISGTSESWGHGPAGRDAVARLPRGETAPSRRSEVARPEPTPFPWVGVFVLLTVGMLVFSFPLFDLVLAWQTLTVYVLCGFALTLFRLIPLPMH